MIPLTVLYDEFIERRKMIERKKPVEHMFPPTTKVGRNKYFEQPRIIVKEK